MCETIRPISSMCPSSSTDAPSAGPTSAKLEPSTSWSTRAKVAASARQTSAAGPSWPEGPWARRRSRRKRRRSGGRGAMAAHGIPIVARAAQTRDDPVMNFAELVGGSTPALADGAMGTLLFEYGLSFGEAPETWNLLHPELVRKVHRGYLEAGSQIVLTNTFGGNRSRLAMHNLEERVPELNRT